MLSYDQRWARATFFWVHNRNSATWRNHFRNRNSSTFKEMLLRNRNSAIPQSQFFLKSATSSPQLESFNSAIFSTFSVVEFGQYIGKNQRSKISCYCPFKEKFSVSRETEDSKNIFFLLLKPAWAEEKGQEVADWQETAESCGIAEVKFWRSAITVPQLFLVHNSAIDLVVRNMRSCGLKLRMPSFGYDSSIYYAWQVLTLRCLMQWVDFNCCLI